MVAEMLLQSPALLSRGTQHPELLPSQPGRWDSPSQGLAVPAKQPRLSEQEFSFPSPLDQLPHCWARLQEAATLLPIPALFSADNHVKPI